MKMKKILITAGEASADRHAATLIRAMKKAIPEAEIFGMGGPEMVDAGFDDRYSMHALSVMGFSNVLPRLVGILRVLRGIKELILKERPDIFIPVDLPDFNMRLARFAHARRVKVLYYIAPQAWAWRRSRARSLAQITDGLAVIFPFEEAFFRAFNVNARYVGHPLLEQTPAISPGMWPPKRIAIMPGSRRDEIVRMLPAMLGAKSIIAKRYRNIQWYLPVAKGLDSAFIRERVDNDVTLTESMPQADLAMVKSGTATFELALQGVPEVICYETSLINYLLAKAFIKVDYIGMPNIVAGKTVVPELIQDAFTAENLAFSLMRYLDDKTLYMDTRSAFIELRSALGAKAASIEVAQWVSDLL
jgi:lipid-A-disaccharide synthase